MQDASHITVNEPLALFLDFDGTLVEIVDRPDLTVVPGSLKELLGNLHSQLSGALAVISGRPIADLDALLNPLTLPAAGIHGLEQRDNSLTTQTLASHSIPDDVRQRLAELAAADPGLIMEDKGHSIGIHFRLAQAFGQQVLDEMQHITATLGPEFMLQHGKMVLELKPAKIHKGSAIERFMAQPPFAGRRAVFLGDDITDEDAFIAVNQLQGYSVKVGAQSAHTAATFALNDVAAVHQWLGSLNLA